MRILTSAALVLGVALLLAGCGDKNAKILSAAIYAKNVPVYKGAHFTETSGSESWGDEPDSYTHGTVWWFETKASKDEMLAYYTKLYPDAEKTDLDTGGVQLRIHPAGAGRFEDVTIVVADHELRIGEDVTPNTQARARGESVPAGGPSPPTTASSDDSGD